MNGPPLCKRCRGTGVIDINRLEEDRVISEQESCPDCDGTGAQWYCPLCGGDCSAANPPVVNCPMHSH